MDKLRFDRTDYSVVVKNRAPPPGSWKWEIYRAGRSSPIKQSSVYFHTMVTANRAGKEALKQLGQAPCKPSRLSGLSPRNVRVESASIHLNEPTLVGATGRSTVPGARSTSGSCPARLQSHGGASAVAASIAKMDGTR
jgi:hypothetical protein